MEFTGAPLWLRVACAAGVGFMIASGVLRGAWGVDVLEHLPSFSVCLAYNLWDFPCPGCGMSRALLRLGQLRFAEANALHPLSLPCALGIAWVATGSPGRDGLRAFPAAASSWGVALAICLVVGVWLLRAVTGSLA